MHDSAMVERLKAQWQGRERFVVLDAGAGAVERFLRVWDVWRGDPPACGQLHVLAIEPRGLDAAELMALGAGSPLETLAESLARQWPAMTPNHHRLSFEAGRVQLTVALGEVSAVLPELVCTVDAFHLGAIRDEPEPSSGKAHRGSQSGHEKPDLRRVAKALARIATSNATLAVDDDSPALIAAITAAGFELLPSTPRATAARFAPRFTPRRSPSRSPTSTANASHHALIIGAGLAGCASAWALAEQGWQTTVLDRHQAPACEASGNPAGLFHGIVNPQDGAHARFNRAAALEAQRLVRRAIDKWGVHGAADGLLRLDDSPSGADSMRAVLSQSGLPTGFVRAVDADEASAIASIPLGRPGWFYPGGGWVDPAQLAAAMLRSCGDKASFLGGVEVRSLRRIGDEWMAFDDTDRCIAKAPVVVLASAGSAAQLLGEATWPLEPVRGQLSMADAAAFGALPRIPVAGAGYLLPDIGGRAIFGATAQPGESDMGVRAADHAYNLTQVRSLTGRNVDIALDKLQGRVGIRWSTDDRLPVIGAVPDIEAAKRTSRLDQPRFVPRLPGAFVFTALGSRGITWCALGAQVLASSITGAPSPLEASLLDAVDAGRFLSRSARRATRDATGR